MKEFRIVPTIKQCDTVKEFCGQLNLSQGDLMFVSGGTYKRYFEGLTGEAKVVDYRQYIQGEPSDVMVEKMHEAVGDYKYHRVIAVGGGAILDVAKLFALEKMTPVLELYDKKFPPVRDKELILVPTTCGTGSEVTNIGCFDSGIQKYKTGFGG